MKIKIPYEKINPVSPDDVRDDELIALALGTMALGVNPIPDEDRSHIEYDIDNDKLPLEIADLITSKGCEITQFPLFIEIDDSSDDCPFLESGTWEDWKLDNHEFYVANGRTFIETNAHTGEYMDWNDLTPVRDQLVLPQDLPKVINE
jgi:hypothetical protein